MRGDSNERLTILSEAEKTALYGIPDFDDFQRVEFFAMTDAERCLALQRRGIVKQVYCLLQIGYFKAKQAFFHFSLDEVPPADVAFLLQRYFPEHSLTVQPLRTNEYYVQRREIIALFSYRLWTDHDVPTLRDNATLLARTDVTPTFLLAELMVLLVGRRIVRPGYSTLQTIIRDALATERERLVKLIDEALTDATREVLQQLLVRENCCTLCVAVSGACYRRTGLRSIAKALPAAQVSLHLGAVFFRLTYGARVIHRGQHPSLLRLADARVARSAAKPCARLMAL